MAKNSITLLELHLGDGDVQFGPKSLGSTDSEEADAEMAERTTESDDSPSSIPRKLAAGVVVLVLLAGVGIAAAKLLDGDLEDAESLDELAE